MPAEAPSRGARALDRAVRAVLAMMLFMEKPLNARVSALQRHPARRPGGVDARGSTGIARR